MLDPTKSKADRVAAGFGVAGNAILTVTDLIPGVSGLKKLAGWDNLSPAGSGGGRTLGHLPRFRLTEPRVPA